MTRMNEVQTVLKAWWDTRKNKSFCVTGAVLATVVHVTGSTYRRPGSRMLLFPDGRHFGSISGGCIEVDISRKAWRLTGNGAPVMRIYDMSSGDDALWEFGSGCDGVIHVLLERMDSASANLALGFLSVCQEGNGNAAIATLIAPSRGGNYQLADRLFMKDNGLCFGSLRGTRIEMELRTHLHACMRERTSSLVHLEAGDLFFEFVGPPPSLFILGAEYEAVPLSALANQLGWRVIVADSRPSYVREERFPFADMVALIQPGGLLDGIEITPDSAVVIMSHNHFEDQRFIQQIRAKNPRYLGVPGQKSRLRGNSPVAGADDAELTALSILAEIHAVFSGREAGYLNGRESSLFSAFVESAERSPALLEFISSHLVAETGVGQTGAKAP